MRRWALPSVRRATGCQDAMVESDPVRIKRVNGTDLTFRSRLGHAWDVGFVADITLTDGTECSVVLVAMSSTALILDRWKQSRHGPAGDPLTLDLGSVAEVVVP